MASEIDSALDFNFGDILVQQIYDSAITCGTFGDINGVTADQRFNDGGTSGVFSYVRVFKASLAPFDDYSLFFICGSNSKESVHIQLGNSCNNFGSRHKLRFFYVDDYTVSGGPTTNFVALLSSFWLNNQLWTSRRNIDHGAGSSKFNIDESSHIRCSNLGTP